MSNGLLVTDVAVRGLRLRPLMASALPEIMRVTCYMSPFKYISSRQNNQLSYYPTSKTPPRISDAERVSYGG
jgi:hypothetical protein